MYLRQEMCDLILCTHCPHEMTSFTGQSRTWQPYPMLRTVTVCQHSSCCKTIGQWQGKLLHTITNKAFCKEFWLVKVFIGQFSNVLPCAFVTESLYFSVRLISILPACLCLGFPHRLLNSHLPTKVLYAFLVYFLIIILTTLNEECKLWSPCKQFCSSLS